MPNGILAHSHVSATQSALLLPSPGSSSQQYLFTVDAVDNNLVGGLRYSIVDMTLRGGLGDIGAVKEVAVPAPNNVKLTEKLTAVRHTNGRDYWIVVHAYGSNAFFSYLLTASGLTMTPVVSNLGTVHVGGGGSFGNGNAVGYLRASPDGRRLASAIREVGLDVFDFNPSTGQISNFQPVNISAPYYYGLEFSPDGSKLYVTDLTGNSIRQVNLLASPLSAQYVGSPGNYTGAIVRGPDNVLYVAVEQSTFLAAITNPNGTAVTCGLVASGASLGTRRARQGLPNFPNRYAKPLLPTLALSIPANACVGSVVPVSSTLSNAPAGATYAWDFGDPSSGVFNTATTPTAAHVYQTFGIYTITLTVITTAGVLTRQYTITVGTIPVVNLGPPQRTICAGESVTLSSPSTPAGMAYHWSDGSTSPALEVRQAGLYVLRVTTPLGCSGYDSVEVQVQPRPTVRLRADTTLCQQALPLLLQANAQPAGSTYRWQDGSTAATFAVRISGTYRLEVRNAQGCTARDSVAVTVDACVPMRIPNIITPNGDGANQTFVLQGLVAPEWSIRIYNRWGREVYQHAQYDNSWAAEGLADGVYYYLLTNPQTGQRYKGWVEVLR
ncbi:gliding motility-associated C-terminal domain-containing protein [Hymenobacter sp. ASUV-10]|uniref:Gliding motility-associated C-terminal domain-containing protein n=1 Tax=Hymenobacter aranciens TaxID=3063996 RepID=A0ABT9BHG2_9BACT|nr:gliding motility-associated C-terminal domain-containing protein [Hymenobacter sp. ASUV-10]MDO7876447.1 gliding motility-associated C-terminal domain-containing protein [Hymenobacter sp. ASUV-10]